MSRAAHHPVFVWKMGRKDQAHVPQRLNPLLSVCGKIPMLGRPDAPKEALRCRNCERMAGSDAGGRPLGLCHCKACVRRVPRCSCGRPGPGNAAPCLAAFRVSRSERPRKSETCSCACHRQAKRPAEVSAS